MPRAYLEVLHLAFTRQGFYKYMGMVILTIISFVVKTQYDMEMFCELQKNQQKDTKYYLLIISKVWSREKPTGERQKTNKQCVVRFLNCSKNSPVKCIHSLWGPSEVQLLAALPFPFRSFSHCSFYSASSDLSH